MHAIGFNPTSEIAETLIPMPRPASEYSPAWYSDMGAFLNKKARIGPDDDESYFGSADLTVKMCVPFRDGMFAGYIQEAWQDIYLDLSDNNPENFKYILPTKSPRMMNHRDTTSMPIGNNFYQTEFVFHPPWTPEVPKGWSVLYTQPINRVDLVTWFPSAIVDNDTFTHSHDESNIPFYIKKDFVQGVIPKGTPLYQMIPIRREAWSSHPNRYDPITQAKISQEPRKTFWGGYKKIFWQKKEYK